MKLFTKQTAVLLTLVILCLTGCMPTPKGYVKRATAIMDKRGLYATGDGWYNMKYGLIHANPQTMEEAHALVSEGLEVAGGKHSGLIEATIATQNDTASWVMPTLTVADDIAQITLPHFMGNKKEGVRYAETILNDLPETLKGAVIDLRGNIPYTMPDGSILILTTSKDVARTGEEFCDDPIAPDSLTETPLADALQWLKDKTMAE